MSFHKKSLLSLLLLEFVAMGFFSLNAHSRSALKGVQITPGINQKRPDQNQQTIGRRYVWNFQRQPYTVLMEIDVEQYNSYSSKDRYDIPKLVEEGTRALSDLIREFNRVIRNNNPSWSKQDKVNYVLSFVQSLPYTLDDVTTGYDEFRRYAIETLIEGGGDCEDTTILVGAILRGLGEQVALIQTQGHIALGVSGDFTGNAFAYRGTKYYYCETTGTGWTVGKLPPGTGQRATVVPLAASPVPLTPESTVVEKTDPARPTPIRPSPTVDPTKPPKPKPSARNRTSAVVAVLAVVFFLVVLAGAGLYLLMRHLENGENDDTDGTSLDDEKDEEFDLLGSSQRDDLLDE